MDKDKLGLIVDTVLFGVPTGDGVITVTNNIYQIQNKKSKPNGLIEKLQIRTGSNLNINNIVARELRDGIVNGILEFLNLEAQVAEKVAQVAKEEDGVKSESKEFAAVAESIVDGLGEEPVGEKQVKVEKPKTKKEKILPKD